MIFKKHKEEFIFSLHRMGRIITVITIKRKDFDIAEKKLYQKIKSAPQIGDFVVYNPKFGSKEDPIQRNVEWTGD